MWLFTPFLQHATFVNERDVYKFGGTSITDAVQKSYWKYRMQRFDELEKIIHCWSSEVGQAFT
jgi:hypothetical protein